MRNYVFSILFLLVVCITHAQTGSSSWVSLSANGNVQYTPDSNGNTIPDFSGVGFENSEKPIPYVPVVKELTPLPNQDNAPQIEAAIAQIVATYSKDPNTGFRGALLLKAGTWQIDNTVDVVNSGILIRGEGSHDDGTIIVADEAKKYTVFYFKGWNYPTTTGTSFSVLGSYIPVGAKSLTLSSGSHGFKVGDKVHLRVTPNQAWVDLIGMNAAGGLGTSSDPVWSPSGYVYSYYRTITGVNGAIVQLDAPVVDMIDARYKTASVIKESWAGDEYVGIEHLRIVGKADAVNVTDGMSWEGVVMEQLQNGFVNDVEVYYTNIHTYIANDTRFVTVKNCRHYYPKSIIEGGYRYSYWIKRGQRVLVANTFSFESRHAYLTGKNTPGPNVFVNGYSGSAQADDGPHENWATGILFDNITSTATIKVQNRRDFGTSHGWVSSACVLWNCSAPTIVNQSPPEHINWAIGCTNVTGDGDKVKGYSDRVNESENNKIPFKLFEKQLISRVGTTQAQSVLGQEPFFFNAPHIVPTVIEAEHYDLGGEGISFHDNEYKNTSGNYRFDGGPDISRQSNQTFINNIKAGEWIEYTVYSPQTTFFDAIIHFNPEITGTISLYLDDLLIGDYSVNVLGKFSNYSLQNIPFQSGEHVLKILFNNAGGQFDFIQLQSPSIVTHDHSSDSKLRTVYPNPFSSNIQLPDTYSWQLIDMLGKVVLQGFSNHIDTSEIDSGSYILKYGSNTITMNKE